MPGATIRSRRNTSVEWQSRNPVPMAGEFLFTTDKRELRIGDGVTPYNELDYYLPSSEFEALIAQALENAGAGDGGATREALAAHIASLTPHSAYDDGPSLLLLYQNAKV